MCVSVHVAMLCVCEFLCICVYDTLFKCHPPTHSLPGTKKSQQQQQAQAGPPPCSALARDLALICSIAKRTMAAAAPAPPAAGSVPAVAAAAAAADGENDKLTNSQQQQAEAGPGAGAGMGMGAGPGVVAGGQEAAAPSSAVKKAAGQGAVCQHHLFQDESLSTFFRRMGWSPDGEWAGAARRGLWAEGMGVRGVR